MSETIQCLRCRTTMELGYVPDFRYGGYTQEQWNPGTARTTFWSGLKVSTDKMIPITTYRCPKCGYLESYANPPEPDQP